MNPFFNLQSYYQEYKNYVKQGLYNCKDEAIKAKHKELKERFINEAIRLVQQEGYSIKQVAQALSVTDKWLFALGVKKRLKSEGYKILEQLKKLKETLKTLTTLFKYQNKQAQEEKKRLKMLLYHKIAYLNKYYDIPLTEIEQALGWKRLYINKALGRKGTILWKVLKEYEEKANTKPY